MDDKGKLDAILEELMEIRAYLGQIARILGTNKEAETLWEQASARERATREAAEQDENGDTKGFSR